MDVLIGFVVNTSPCILGHQVECFKYIPFLMLNYTSIKLKKKGIEKIHFSIIQEKVTLSIIMNVIQRMRVMVEGN